MQVVLLREQVQALGGNLRHPDTHSDPYTNAHTGRPILRRPDVQPGNRREPVELLHRLRLPCLYREQLLHKVLHLQLGHLLHPLKHPRQLEVRIMGILQERLRLHKQRMLLLFDRDRVQHEPELQLVLAGKQVQAQG